MKPVQPIVIFFACFIIYSCNNGSANKIETIKNDSIVSNTGNISSKKTNPSRAFTNQENAEDTITDIAFKELSVSINRLQIDDKDKKNDQVQKDTVRLYAAIGETIEKQKITVTTTLLTNLTVEQRYETSVTIMDEGPHYDLTGWKHYTSDWKPLQPNSNGIFTGDTYSEKEKTKFPEINIEELKEKVKTQCGMGWYQLVLHIKSPTDYPGGVGISRYFLRVAGKRKDNGLSVIKIISIEIPMGC